MQSSSKTSIVVALITAIGSIAAALIAGYYLLQNTTLQKTLDLTMTAYVKEQAETSAAQQVLNEPSSIGDTPYSVPTTPPVEIEQPPTETPKPIVILPTDTLMPVQINTNPNSTLSVGETWSTSGLDVLLQNVDFRFSDEMDIDFVFINNTGKTLFFNFNESTNVTLTDNNGNIYTWDNVYKQDVVLENGDTYTEQVFKGGNFSGAQYFIIELNIPGVITARWRYN